MHMVYMLAWSFQTGSEGCGVGDSSAEKPQHQLVRCGLVIELSKPTGDCGYIHRTLKPVALSFHCCDLTAVWAYSDNLVLKSLCPF